jgi:hypothetical protein
MILLICMTSTQMTGNAQMDARMMENEAIIQANLQHYRDRQAIAMNELIISDGKSSRHWLKGLNNVVLLIVGRL